MDSGSALGFILIVGLIIGLIFLTRLFGSWMLRIDEVIDELKKIKALLEKQQPKE